MIAIELKITAHAALAIGRQKPGTSVSEAEQFIPGGVIRGAIAGYILRLAGQQGQDLSQSDNEFRDLFLGAEPAIFQNAYCAIAKESEHQWRCVDERIQVLPATAVSAKNNPGFRAGDAKKGGVFDTLIDRFCADQVGYPYSPTCPMDGDRVEPFSSFYSCDAQNNYRQHKASTRFLTRVGINRRRATAQDQMLYSVEVLNESFVRDTKQQRVKWEYVAYRSIIYCPDQLAPSLVNFINCHGNTFRLGGSTSRGLGRVIMQAVEKAGQQESLPETVGDRIQRFNQKLQERWQLWSVLGQGKASPVAEKQFFAITLQAEAILSEHWRRTMVLSGEMLQAMTGVADGSLKLEVAYSSYDYRGGWNSAWGLMKDMELMTNRGAVYLFSTTNLQGWLEALTKLEVQGIGDRTVEGFGQVSICNPFHTIFREAAV
ncbi:CRISPR-associated RAMP protein Csx10 [Alkalinema pantanalense CENA528]|uniref:type III-D CRISPR-associated RAMP protein Csx10 n=1 Tax=Alkalinema pantanalense TaxID=1620705 RepID=UPI003D6F4776